MRSTRYPLVRVKLGDVLVPTAGILREVLKSEFKLMMVRLWKWNFMVGGLRGNYRLWCPLARIALRFSSTVIRTAVCNVTCAIT
jgi:hypothetical protein